MSLKDVPNAQALPASAQFSLRPNAVPAKRTRVNIQPYQYPVGAITTNQVIQFYIPSRRGTMYDPQTAYVRGTITGVTTTTNGQQRLNRNAFSVFNRLQVYGQDSTLLEDVQNYNDLCHVLMDTQMSREDKYALSPMYAGSDSSVTTAFTANVPAADILVNARGAGGAAINPADAGALLAIFQAGGRIGRIGAAVGAADAAVAVAVNPTTTTLIDNGVVFADGNATLDFCVPIVSSFGLLADKMIPTGWLNSDLRFDFYTELPNVAFRSHNAAFANPEAVTAYQLTNLELVVDMIEFSDMGLQMVQQMAPPSGPLYLHATTYKTYTSTIQNGTTGFYTQLLPHRSLSVKQVLSASHIANANGYDSFARVLPYGSANLQLGLNIGGSKFPQKPISKPAEAFAELQKSQHAFNQLILNGSISRTEYVKYLADNSSIANALTCKPVIGFDTEIYDKKGGTIVNGQNWTGLNVFAEGFAARNANGDAINAVLTTNHFVLFDVIYVVQDGTISVRF